MLRGFGRGHRREGCEWYGESFLNIGAAFVKTRFASQL